MLSGLHKRFVYGRRIATLTRHLLELIPQRGTVLDVGSGDGLLASRLQAARPALTIRGVDVLPRPTTFIPVEQFDGVRLPFADRSFDAVMMIDVLHHATDQVALLREVARVAASVVVIKDHVLHGWMAGPTLTLMDWVGNAPHGVALPYSYWTNAEWKRHVDDAGLAVVERRERLGLYPWPATLLFDRGLHVILALERRPH
jgi:SAM-dependent methyltransferase